jgi:hypothetical protein
MTRKKLPYRRGAVTRKIPLELANGKSIPILVTVGFDSEGRVSEVFCADFKAGSDAHAIVVDVAAEEDNRT